MNERLGAFVAGVAGMALAFGLAELVHGLYGLVPSVPVAVSQRVIELTPGDFATAAIGGLGKAATPVLVTVVVVATVLFAGLLAVLWLRSRLLAVLGLVTLAVTAVFAAFAEPFVAPVATVLTVLGALGAGVLAAALMYPAVPSAAPAAGETEEEVRTPAGRRREAHSPEGTSVGRGSFLALAGGVAVAGAAAAGAGRALTGDTGAARTPAPLDRRGGSGGETTGAGEAQASEPAPYPPPDRVSVDVDGVPPWVTPAGEFYLIDTAISSPRIDRERWKLSVKGAVGNPFEMTYDELVSMPNREEYITLSCVSNEVGGGLVSNGLWTGVPLRDVLREAGLSREEIGRKSEQLVGRSVDGWTSGFRTDIAFERPDALVAFGLNGSELPQKHGYPVRLVVPGLYGYVSATKWLSEIELTGWDFDAYWIKRGWSKTGPIKTQSRIDTPSPGATVQAGTVPVAGVAWAPARGIRRVEVSTDGGESWTDARLAAQLDEDAWRQWAHEWDAEPGEHTLKVRATDGEGETQTEEQAPPIPSGATGYHTINVTVE